MRLGTGEILLILAVVLLMFGGTKLPQLGEALGKTIRSFKRAVGEVDGDAEGVAEQVPAALPPAVVVTPAGRREAVGERPER